MSRRSMTTAVVMGLMILAAAGVRAGDWPMWRGPAGTGISDEKGMPREWSETKNVKWKVELPAPGNSTPVIWKDRIYMTSATKKGEERSLLCMDRTTGRTLWEKSVQAPAGEKTHETNPYAASSPATDGKRIIVWHGSAGLIAYDMDGKELWKKDLGKFEHIWGYASSPLLSGDRVYVSCGPGVRAFVASFDAATGNEVWKKEFDFALSKDAEEFKGSWSTPVLRPGKGEGELLISLPKFLVSLEPSTGKEIWRCGGMGPLVYTSPVFDGDVVVAMGGYMGPAIGVRLGGTGDVTATHRLWLHEKGNPQRVGSGVVVEGHLYILNENGFAWCIELKSGDIKWKQRVTTPSWSSMVYADGMLWIINKQSQTLLIKPDAEKCLMMGTNTLQTQTTQASLAFSDGQIFIRTFTHLYCIEKGK